MRYDLALIERFCGEIGLACARREDALLVIELGGGIELCFENHGEDDCLVGFSGMPWHVHGNFIFSDRHGNMIELDYLDVVAGLPEGVILLCEEYRKGVLADRSLVHRDYVDEFRFLQKGDEIRISRF